MFNKLIDFSYRRTPLEVVGFYLAYVILVTLICALAGGVVGIIVQPPPEEAFQFGAKVGGVIAIIACLILSFVVIAKKKRLTSLSLIIMAILSGAGALFYGALLGVLPIAIITTRENGVTANDVITKTENATKTKE